MAMHGGLVAGTVMCPWNRTHWGVARTLHGNFDSRDDDPCCRSSKICYSKDNRFGNCGVSDPKPTCGVAGPPIRGQNVTLSCTMTYRRLTDENILNPRARFSASISWESAAGTFLRNSSTPVTQYHGGRVFTVGETLTVDVVTFASGTKIPSYNCTAEFQFTGKNQDKSFIYALNDLSWTCISAPVYTWCTYFNLLC